MPLWGELPLLLLVALCLAVLIRTFWVQSFEIPSESMMNTLKIGDRVLVDKVITSVRDPLRGEIVVFRGPERWPGSVAAEPVDHSFTARLGRTLSDLVGAERPGEKHFIKRVIGVPGDRVACCDSAGLITVNGRSMPEEYVFENSPVTVPPEPQTCSSRQFDEVTVPPRSIWVMGDHRSRSSDARCNGPVPIDNVIGPALLIVWPFSRFGRLDVPAPWRQLAVDERAAGGADAPPGTAPPAVTAKRHRRRSP